MHRPWGPPVPTLASAWPVDRREKCQVCDTGPPSPLPRSLRWDNHKFQATLGNRLDVRT